MAKVKASSLSRLSFLFPLMLSSLVPHFIATPITSTTLSKRDASGPFFTNDHGFADPGVVKADDGKLYAFATQAQGVNVPVACSEDSKNWELMKDPNDPSKNFDAMGHFTSWVDSKQKSLVWAPDVAKMVRERRSTDFYSNKRTGL